MNKKLHLLGLLLCLLILGPQSGLSGPHDPDQDTGQQCLERTDLSEQSIEGFKKVAGSLVHPHWNQLVLKSGDKVTISPATNYYLDENGKPRKYMEKMIKFILNRDPKEQLKVNDILTQAHSDYEMSFRVKDPDSGLYDKVFSVPVNAMAIPFPKKHLNDLIQSTEPVMRALRDMLQKIYSLGPDEINAKNLKITHLPLEEQKALIKAIKESIYYNKAVSHHNMKDYPFLAVGGFDAAISDPERVNSTFFEYNLGTPSGLSNNIQLLEILREKDPEFFKTFGDHLSKDETFTKLRKAIESNALKWTGIKDGISVIVGPGEFNGAHPDVASIALFSGMPLVNKEDLYVDKKGNLRLNVGKGKDNPIVTGIYSRAEESFFLQSMEDEIPIISPHFNNNPELGKKFGLDLKPGVWYDFIHAQDEQGNFDFENIIGVNLDEKGNPKILESLEKLGIDPTDPLAKRGNLINLIKNKKLYFSGLGGRTVDDKKVFQVVHDYLAQSYLDKGQDRENIAHPPRTYRVSEYGKFYGASDEDLKNFVVKITDSSGGDGVYLLVNLPLEKRREIVEAVKKDPHKYIVQDFMNVAVMSTATQPPGKKNPEFQTQANDIRLFTFLDGDGNISGSNHSLLLRAAAVGKGASNTSQGGGYGIGVVVEDAPQKTSLKSILPDLIRHPYLTQSKKMELVEYIDYLNEFAKALAEDKSFPYHKIKFAAQTHRSLMEVLGRNFSPFMGVLRDFDKNLINDQEFFLKLLEFRNKLYDTKEFPIVGLENIIHSRLAGFNPTIKKSSLPLASREKRMDQLNISPKSEHLKVRDFTMNGKKFNKMVVGTYEGSKNAYINDTIQELQEAGGKMNYIRDFNVSSKSWSPVPSIPYFHVEDDGTPSINIDMTADYALSALSHERQHLQHWKKWKDKFMEEEGLSEKDAALKARAHLLTPEWKRVDERQSVEEEFKMNNKDHPILNRGALVLPSKENQIGFISRFHYPDIEYIRSVLHEEKWSQKKFDEAQLVKDLQKMILSSLNMRKEAYEAQLKEVGQLQKQHSSSLELERAKHEANYISHKSIFSSLFDMDQYQFETDETMPRLQELYLKAYKKLGDKTLDKLVFHKNETVPEVEKDLKSQIIQQQQ